MICETVSPANKNFVELQITGVTFPVIVDYDLLVKDAVSFGGFNWVDDGITDRNFPTKRKGTARIIVKLSYSNYDASIVDVIGGLCMMGMRPVELHELLAFSEKYPDIQRKLQILALGSIWRKQRGYSVVPCLSGSRSGRGLDLKSVDDVFDEFHRFAAVKA